MWAPANVRHVIPILRMFDVAATKRLYLDYLGFTLVHEIGAGDRPVYLILALGDVRLHLSSHHGDGTPGTAVLLVTGELDELHATLAGKGYPFMNPGIEPAPGGGRELVVLDPASNQLRFYEPGSA
jgi:hypothetical protein